MEGNYISKLELQRWFLEFVISLAKTYICMGSGIEEVRLILFRIM
jgi:hypothetical protein